MAGFCPNLSARAVDARLKQSLEALRQAEKNAVLWFAEVMQRRLYRDLGYSSIQQYAELELGFKKARTSQFIRLSEALLELPKLRESVARGDVSWTKARELSGVATRKTESAWIAEAQKSTSRELERKVAVTKQRVKAARSGADAQGQMPGVAAASVLAGFTGGSAQGTGSTEDKHLVGNGSGNRGNAIAENVVRPDFEPPAEVPSDLHYRLSPTQFARYEALMEKLRKLGVQGSREELMLECMEIALEAKTANREGKAREDKAKGSEPRPKRQEVAGRGRSSRDEIDESQFPRGNSGSPGQATENPGHSPGNTGNQGQTAGSRGGKAKSPGGNAKSPYQVTVWMCEGCGTGTVETGRGPRKLAPATLKAILCDAMVRKRGKRNRSVLPARVRRQVMERDRMRCRAAGCNRTRFLTVHHLQPKVVGGPHDPDNLVTLCEGCHQAAHRHTGPPSLRKAPSRIAPSPKARSRKALSGKVVSDHELVRDRLVSYSVDGMADRPGMCVGWKHMRAYGVGGCVGD